MERLDKFEPVAAPDWAHALRVTCLCLALLVLMLHHERVWSESIDTQIQDINRLLKQHKQMQKMMKKLGKKGGMANMMRGMNGMMGQNPPGRF